MTNPPSKANPGAPERVPGGRLAYERGIRYSSLPAPSRHLALTIATWAHMDTGVIPERFMPALSTLEEATGLSHGAVVKHLKTLEAEGWLGRETGGGRSNRTQYRLRIPAGAKTGHEVTSKNRSRGDQNPGNRSRGDQETGHDVTSNRSRGDHKSSSSPEESLSPVPPAPTAAPEPPAAPSTERETDAARNKPTASQRAVRASQAVQLEDEAAFIAWIVDKYQPRGPGWWRTATTDLPELADTWRAQQNPNPAQQPASPPLPRWCGHCNDGDDTAATDPNRRWINHDDGTSTRCHCHPYATPAAA